MKYTFRNFLATHLVIRKDPEYVYLRVRRESKTLFRRRDDPSDERPMTETVVQRLLVRPVRALANLPEMGVGLGQA